MTASKLAVSKSNFFNVPAPLTLLVCLMVFPAFAQLQWSSYNNTGVLVTTNVASGGDSVYGGSVTFTIPATTQRIFTTETFAPVSIATASSSMKVNFTMSANGGLYPGSTGRILGMGLLNDPKTSASRLTDTGYWTDFNTGNPSFELFDRPSTVTTFFQYDSPDKLGTGKVATGYPSNSLPYGMQFQLNMNSSANSISIGTSSSSFAACGAGMTNGGPGVNEVAYSSGVSLTSLPTTTFNEFAFEFDNTSASSVQVTLSGITLAPANAEITSPPLGVSDAAGTTATFTVVVNTNAATPIGYQWYETNGSGVVALTNGATGNGSTISGASTAGSTLFTNTLTFSSVQIADANGSIFVVMTNAYGSVTSTPVALAVTAGDTAPSISSISFTNAIVISGDDTNVSVTALGSPAPTYYWYDNNNNLIQSGPGFTLALNDLQLGNAGTYTVTASNYLGTASTNFTIGIIVPPCISQQPGNVLVNFGGPVNFYVVEGGCALPAPTYQWYKNAVLISGATATNYSIASVGYGDIANYTVVVSNSAGAVTSSKATLAIYSTNLSGAPLLPANNSTGVCYDTPLYITFNGPVSVVNSGKIRIYNATNPVTPVDTIDMSANTVVISPTIGITNNIQPHSLFSGDSQVINYFPVIVTGTTAAIYPHSGVMTSNQTYYVTMDSGIVADTNAAYFVGISDTNEWQFTTKPTGPANATNLVVAADGSGDFVTVQGAVDSVPPGNTNYTVINIHNGNYVEIVDISGKNNITFSGQSRSGTLVGYPNNNNLTGTTAARMAFKVNSSDIKLENLTVTNGTPQGGSQAESLLIYNNGLRCVVDNCDIVSRQDTILINATNSQGYFYNCRVVGNYDYIWGEGVGYFDTCIFHTITNSLSSSYNLTAARTATSSASSTNTPWVNPNGATYSADGFSLVNCTIEADPGVTGITLADANGTAGGLDSWVDCRMDTNAYVSPSIALSNTYVFWQNNNLDITGTYSISFTNVQTIGVTNSDPRLLAATNIITWFNGWQPQLAPFILTNPANQSVSGGGTATFTMAAVGIGAPSYQWLENGSPIPSQTNPTLTITNANANNAGLYSVIVSNSAGFVTSSSASLTVGNTAPTLGPVSNQTVNVGVTVTVNDVATDPDVPAQTLTYSLLSGPPGASLNSSNGTFVWRPTVSAANTANLVEVVVTDNGTPNLSATNSFSIIVNPLTQPNITAPVYSNGQFSMSVTGQVGPDYALQMSTNLSGYNWVTLLRTNSPPSPFTFTDTNAAGPQQFYRIIVGPPLP
jgi:pectin methylesterase-like acyl-CoA thioesterase